MEPSTNQIPFQIELAQFQNWMDECNRHSFFRTSEFQELKIRFESFKSSSLVTHPNESAHKSLREMTISLADMINECNNNARAVNEAIYDNLLTEIKKAEETTTSPDKKKCFNLLDSSLRLFHNDFFKSPNMKSFGHMLNYYHDIVESLVNPSIKTFQLILDNLFKKNPQQKSEWHATDKSIDMYIQAKDEYDNIRKKGLWDNGLYLVNFESLLEFLNKRINERKHEDSLFIYTLCFLFKQVFSLHAELIINPQTDFLPEPRNLETRTCNSTEEVSNLTTQMDSLRIQDDFFDRNLFTQSIGNNLFPDKNIFVQFLPLCITSNDNQSIEALSTALEESQFTQVYNPKADGNCGVVACLFLLFKKLCSASKDNPLSSKVKNILDEHLGNYITKNATQENFSLSTFFKSDFVAEKEHFYKTICKSFRDKISEHLQLLRLTNPKTLEHLNIGSTDQNMADFCTDLTKPTSWISSDLIEFICRELFNFDVPIYELGTTISNNRQTIFVSTPEKRQELHPQASREGLEQAPGVIVNVFGHYYVLF